jgi:hypothetical protein
LGCALIPSLQTCPPFPQRGHGMNDRSVQYAEDISYRTLRPWRISRTRPEPVRNWGVGGSWQVNINDRDSLTVDVDFYNGMGYTDRNLYPP